MPNSPSSVNKYNWMYNVDQIDEVLARGWKFSVIYMPKGEYSPTAFSEWLMAQEEANPELGSITISVTEVCGEKDISIWRHEPLNDEDLDLLRKRKEALIQAENKDDIRTIQRYRELISRRPDLAITEESNA